LIFSSHLESIFFAALGKGTLPERAAFLDKACAADAELRLRVERMLEAQAGGFMQEPAPGLPAVNDEPIKEGPGEVIGPYKLMEQIGEGGFGLVFVAAQHHPVRRKVALKIIKPGMDTRDVIARFEAERQALALMDHPNIAKVFDAGATESGRPYFVMELVHGVPITEYCDQNRLSPRQRLELFLSLCHAIQHAHQKGIIHRDVKPTNVMVTLHDGRPVVKVIDFGVAKALRQQLTDRTIYTQFAQMLGTPLYMSPEQAEMSGLDIDTRSDIYSLGVLMYELLTGTTPLDRTRISKAAALEIRRILSDEEPPKPSTRLSQSGDQLTSIAAQRNMEPTSLSRLIRGDLDWIVMKCLEKDRNRRYETASSLASDIENYLHDEPVVACPPSATYRLRKFARRNKVAVVAAAAILASLTIGAGISTWLYFRERAARVDAEVATANESQLRVNDQATTAIREALLVLRSRGADAAERHLESLTPLHKQMSSANMASIHNLLGHLRGQQNRLQEAAMNFAKAAELEPDKFERYQYYVPLLVHTGERDGYQRVRHELIKHFGHTPNPRYAERALKICLITPWPDADFSTLDRLAVTALKTDPRHWAWPYTQFAIGLLEYRRENYRSAVERLQQAVGRMDRFCEVQASMVLAMAHHKLGDVDQAKGVFASGIKYFARIPAHEAALLYEALWHDWMIALALQDEASMLIADSQSLVSDEASGVDAAEPSPALPE
jgi:serine/threonine protein kinase